MAAKLPEIANSADRLFLQGRKLIGRIGRLRLFAETFDPKIDLAHIKAGCLKIEAEIEDRELLELLPQQPVVPGRVFRQAVVGNCKGTSLRGIEMLDRDHRDLAPAELLRRQNPAMAGAI